MGLLTSWMYPIRGIVFLCTSPELLRLVLRFMGIVTASSTVSAILCFSLLWGPHMAVLGRFLGVNLFTRLITALLLTAESAIPIYLIFDHRLNKLGRQLFDATMQLKLGRSAPAGSVSHSEALAALQQAPQARQQLSLAPLQPQDQQALNRLLTRQRQAEVTARQHSTLLGAAASLAVQLLFKPQAGENILIRKGRDFATLGFTALVPGAALLLPLLLYRDSDAEVSSLMSRYYEVKGVKDGDARALLAQHHMAEMRGFGLVATALSYIPVLNWALGLSNHVAAALYAAHLEAKGAPLLRSRW